MTEQSVFCVIPKLGDLPEFLYSVYLAFENAVEELRRLGIDLHPMYE